MTVTPQKSGSSSASSKRSYRYRTVAPCSQVDELLFGSGSREKATTSAKDRSQRTKEGETIQIITRDLIRTIRIPRKNASPEPVILPRLEFERIISSKQVLSKDQREAFKQAQQKKKEEELSAAEERKRQIYEADLSRKQNQALTEMDLEGLHRAQHLRERADALRMEQEDEIKRLNQLILGAKCQATRDAQMQEKKQIQAELAEEEKRLDTIMESERRKALETVERIDEVRKQQRIRGMQEICKQIQQRMEEKQLQDELKEEERQKIRENQERKNLEDIKALEEERARQQLLQEEIKRINAEIQRAKEQKKEEEKLADLRAMEYVQKKMGQEAEYEAEQRRIKTEKELEIARLRAQQERARDFRAEQDEVRARRNQEAADREWRRKERELAVKKAKEEAMLRAARLEQIHSKEHCLSMEAGREKAEFERTLKVQKEAMVKHREEEERQRQKAQHHIQAIRQQMKERELSAISKRRDTFQEASRLVEEARQRRVRLDEMKEKKLRELKATGLSEKYCSEVERKAQTLIKL
ncbi:cilia- and flagella-associated protein 45 [Pholidichthys leucotaenia]